jgi:hypothetical protein
VSAEISGISTDGIEFMVSEGSRLQINTYPYHYKGEGSIVVHGKCASYAHCKPNIEVVALAICEEKQEHLTLSDC